MAELDDEQLMAAFVEGSQDAFAELFARYKQPLYGFFYRRISNPNHAEDLTQDTFVAVIRSSQKYVPSALFRTYLYAIGLKILKAYRRRTVFRNMFHGLEPEGYEPIARSALHTDVLIRQAMYKLDGRDREILLLREFEQLSYSEIAQVLSLPVNTVRTRLFKARATLHDLLAAPAERSADSVIRERV